MTPEQALQVLDAAAAESHINRADHVRVQEAVSVLFEFIKEVRDNENSDEI